MDSLQTGVITLLRSALTGEKLALPEDFDLEQAYGLMRRHQILSAGYLGAVQCGISKELPVMRQMFKDYCAILFHSEQQTVQVERLFTAFDEAQVDYMPVKGCEMKKLYPKPELRTMGDADILIRMEQYDTIRAIMEKLGYGQGKESDHELVWSSHVLLVELHKRLFPSNNKDYFDYYGDGWQRTKSVRGTRYAMSREDEFVYLLTHFAKHYRDGGIGLRHVADLWLFEKAHGGQLDRDYINSQLNRLQMLEFYGNISDLLQAWFEDGPWNDTVRLLSQVIFESGAWGARSAHILADIVRKKQSGSNLLWAKLKRLWNLSFLPLWIMKQKYPVLEKYPVLLPWFWVVRIVDILFFTKGKMAQHTKEFTYMTRQRVDEYEQALDFVGLHFNFKE